MVSQKFSLTTVNSRLSTSLILALVLIVAWWVGGWLFFLFVLAVGILAQWEVYAMFLPHKEDFAYKVGGLLLGGLFLLTCQAAPGYPTHLSLLAMAVVLGVAGLFSWQKEFAALNLKREVIVLAGFVYIPLLISPALHFSRPEQALIIMTPAFSDMAAYFVGMAMGKHKIWPSISPKKSVEGSVAGLLVSILTCIVFGLGWGVSSLWSFVFLGLFLGVLAQLGDFFESSLKRTVGVKDSGTLLPGHGGVLDRIDSILFCCAAYAVFEPLMGFFG